jgi:hypothetical protein
LFNCARCHLQQVICRRCDRGQRYCAACAVVARSDRLRAAGRRYQATPRGRACNARRQQRFRLRQRKVTHQGSQPAPSAVSCAPSVIASPLTLFTALIVCHFCGQTCALRLRRRWLRYQAETRPFTRRAHRSSG